MDFSRATILCLGDVMLDRFAYCDTERISPEAPVPVLLLRRAQSMLGGAGNVARNIAALGGTAVLIGLVGQDAAGDEARALLAAAPGIIDRHVASSAPRGRRLQDPVSGREPAVDAGRRGAHARLSTPDEEAALIAAVEGAVAEADAVILSDYGKGVLAPHVLDAAIAGARGRGVPVYVDPKGDDFTRYRGATCITPNQRELALAARLPTASDAEIVAAATQVLRDSGVDAVLATRSEKGMVLIEASGAVHFEAARAREVFDVSGAGDTVVAVLALAARRRLSAAAGDAARQHRRRDRRQQARHRDGRTRRADARTGARRARHGMAPHEALQPRRDRGAGAALEEPRAAGRVHQRRVSTSCMPGMSRCWRRRARNATG